MWGLASSAFLAPIWWTFDVIGVIRGPRRWYTPTKPPMDKTQLAIAIVMLIHHLVIFVHLVYLSRYAARRLVQLGRVWACPIARRESSQASSPEGLAAHEADGLPRKL